jgi:hypothetical protein
LREVVFSHAFTAKVKKIMKNPAARRSTGGGSAQLLPNARRAREGAERRNEVAGTMTSESPKVPISGGRSRRYVSQRIERKTLWEPRRVEGDGHATATCGFTRPRSFTEDNAFHQCSSLDYGRSGGVGRGLGGGLDLGVAVGVAGGVAVGVRVTVAVGVGVVGGVAVGVWLAVAVGVGVVVAVGVWLAVAVAVGVVVAVGVWLAVAVAVGVVVAVGVWLAVAVAVGVGVPAGTKAHPPVG